LLVLGVDVWAELENLTRVAGLKTFDTKSVPGEDPVVSRLGTLALALMLALACGDPGLGAQSKPLPLSARVIAHGEFVGVGPSGPSHLQTFRSAAPFLVQYQQVSTPSQVSAWVALLHREGFVAVVVEQLGSPTAHRRGLSWAMELGSPADAKSEVAKEFDEHKTQGHAAQFRVGGIPAASAFRLGTSSNGGDNIFFADGRFMYFVGDGWNNGGTPARAALIAAAQSLYKRVHGHPAA
jgi:hypothetical protein